MSDNPTCPQFPARPPHGGGEPFIAPPAPCRKPGLSVLSVNGRTPDRNGDLALAYIDGAEYAAGYGDPPRPALLFRQGDEVVAVVDATPLLKDGMVSSVEVSGGKLVVTFNTDAGKEPVEIPLTDIFDPASYYDKVAADGRFALKGEMSVAAGTGADADKTTITLMPGVLATVLSAHQPLDAYFNAAEYDSAGRKILLKHGSVVKAQIDATAFIKDGMVSSVAISSGKLVITFNTDAGLEPIEIPLTDIFNPANYYDKTATDTLLSGKADKVANATSGNLASLDENGNLADSGKAIGDFALAESLAPVFVTGYAYEVGDLCTSFDNDSNHKGTWLYKCILATDGSQFEPPETDPTHWALATVEDLLAALRTAVANVGTPIAPSQDSADAGKAADAYATGMALSAKAEARSGTQGNIAVYAEYSTLLEDSGYAPSDFASADALNGKANKVANAISGNLAGFDSSGDLTDSGCAPSNFATPADIPSASSTSPSMDGTAAVGVSDDYARSDHVHPSDTSKADDNAVVKLTGDQSIGGTKTFTDAAYFNMGLAAPSTLLVHGQDSSARFEVNDGTTGDYVRFGVGDFGVGIGFEYTKNGSSYRVDLPERSGVLSVKADVDDAVTAVEDVLAALRTAVAGKVGSFASVGGASATVENGVAKLSDFFTESNSLLTATIDAEVISKGTAPDAHIEAPTDEHLRLILADNSVAYDSAKALPYKLTSVIGDRVIATMTLTAASTDITLPTVAANDTTVKDFILDVTNAYAVEGVATDAGINIPRTDFKLVTRDGESLTAVTTVKAGKSAFICFTQKSPVVVDGTTYPCWCVIQLPFGDPS